MKIIYIAWKYLKNYKAFSLAVLLSIIVASFFEGVSFGIIIPLLQSMTGSGSNLVAKIPFITHLMGTSADRARVVSILFISLFALMFMKNVFSYVTNMFIARLRLGMVRDLSVKLMNNLIDYDIAFFDNAKTGHLLNNMYSETTRMGNFIMAALSFVANLGNVIAYIVVLFMISYKASLLIFGLIGIVLLPLEIVLNKMKELSSKSSRVFTDFNHKMMEIFSGIRIIKMSATEEQEKKGFAATAGQIFQIAYKNNSYINMLIPICEISVFGLITLYFLITINVTRIDIPSAFPYLATFLLVLVKALTQLNVLNGKRSEAMTNIAALPNYEALCDERDKRTIISGRKAVSRVSSGIEFKDVSFSYKGGKRVLNNIDLVIPKGKVTAIVGPSGSGKSTILNLILRFYAIDSGTILVDGMDIKDLDLKSWRRRIGFVSQDTFIFNASVRDNISYGCRQIDDSAIIAAATRSYAHDFIMNMPNRYDTVLGERGIKLSGGQKQRISIARAIIHDPDILILDEATSSLDTETEKLLKEALDALTKDRTVIAIAHRLSTILHADNILVLDNGRIAEEGSHADLVRRSGLYNKLYQTQFSV